jgi:hypothetical protein
LSVSFDCARTVPHGGSPARHNHPSSLQAPWRPLLNPRRKRSLSPPPGTSSHLPVVLRHPAYLAIPAHRIRHGALPLSPAAFPCVINHNVHAFSSPRHAPRCAWPTNESAQPPKPSSPAKYEHHCTAYPPRGTGKQPACVLHSFFVHKACVALALVMRSPCATPAPYKAHATHRTLSPATFPCVIKPIVHAFKKMVAHRQQPPGLFPQSPLAC